MGTIIYKKEEIFSMASISENVRIKFEELPVELKNYINKKDVTINNMTELMKVLEDISNEYELI